MDTKHIEREAVWQQYKAISDLAKEAYDQASSIDPVTSDWSNAMIRANTLQEVAVLMITKVNKIGAEQLNNA